MIIEGRLFENSADLRLITDSISNLVAYVDSDHRYRFANRALEEWFGLPGARIVGARVRDLVGEEDYEYIRPYLTRALKGERVSTERTMRRFDGHEIHVHTTYSPDADSYGTTPGVVIVATDISDRKRAEESLALAYKRAVGLNRVGQAIRQRRAIEDIQRIALEVLAETLNVDRALSMLVDRPRNSVEFIGDWHRPGLPDLKGQYSIPQFGVNIEEIFPTNNTLVVDDIHNDRFSPTTIGVLASMYISSFVDVPLSEDEEVVGILGVNMAQGTRQWTPDEVAFVESVASQLRAATEARRLLSHAQARAEREELINKISAAIRTDMDPDGIQEIAAKMLGEALRADRCLYVSYDLGRGQITVEEDWRREGLSSLAGVYPASDLRQSMKILFPEGATAVFRDVGVDVPGELTNMAARLEVRALLGVPLYHAGELTAAVFVGMSEARREWTSDEVDIVQQVATLTRTAVEEASINKRERAIATELQAALQPPLPDTAEGLDLAMFYQSALHGASVGGDFYDVFPLGPGVYAMVVGDLSGKGLFAAAQVATVRNMLRFALHNAPDLAAAVTALNRTIVENRLLPGFATMFVGRFDVADRTLSYVNCGQEAGLLLRPEAGAVDLLMPTGPTLGIDADAEYSVERVSLSTGDAVVLFTDGYTEAGPNRDMMLGVQGLAQYARDMGTVAGAEQLVSRLTQRALDWAQGEIRDDMCLLAAVVT